MTYWDLQTVLPLGGHLTYIGYVSNRTGEICGIEFRVASRVLTIGAGSGLTSTLLPIVVSRMPAPVAHEPW